MPPTRVVRSGCAGEDSLERDPSYLTIEQALADYATLISHIKAEYEGEGSPVIAFGGSYGGMLAAWLRAKYPNAVQVSQCLRMQALSTLRTLLSSPFRL